jgi:site-specific recombinase XerC
MIALWAASAPDQAHAHLSAHGKLRAVQLLLGHQKSESTLRYLGVEVDDALEIAEKIEV